MLKIFFSITVVLFFNSFGFTQNPIIKNIGMSDPHARVFNDTLFLYTGHDAHPTDTTWVMKIGAYFQLQTL